MFRIDDSSSPRVKWDDGDSGKMTGAYEGHEGWYLDTSKYRYIMMYGAWWGIDRSSPTRGFGDLIAVLMFIPLLIKKHFGHGGFLTYAKLGFDYLKKSDLLKTDKPLILIGHSLGAASMSHIAMWLKEDGHKIENVYLFGVPTYWANWLVSLKFRKMFPKSVAYTVQRDFTRFLKYISLVLVGIAFGVTSLFNLSWVVFGGIAAFILLFLTYVSPQKLTIIKKQSYSIGEWFKSFSGDHWPWEIENDLPNVVEIEENK